MHNIGSRIPILNPPLNQTRRTSNMSIYNPDDFYEHYNAVRPDPDEDNYDDDQHQEHEGDEYESTHNSDEPDSDYAEQMDEIEEEDPNFYFDDEDDGSAPDRGDD
jgi:hypothetical protein